MDSMKSWCRLCLLGLQRKVYPMRGLPDEYVLCVMNPGRVFFHLKWLLSRWLGRRDLRILSKGGSKNHGWFIVYCPRSSKASCKGKGGSRRLLSQGVERIFLS